jgi:plasmid maintenance system antidote protein VapI
MARTGAYIVPTEAFHPGETLEEKLQEMGLSYIEFSTVSGLDIDTVKGIVSCKIDVNPKIAKILERYTQIPQDFWLNKQETFNRYRMEKLAKSLVNDMRKDFYGRKQQIKSSAESLYRFAESL